MERAHDRQAGAAWARAIRAAGRAGEDAGFTLAFVGASISSLTGPAAAAPFARFIQQSD